MGLGTTAAVFLVLFAGSPRALAAHPTWFDLEAIPGNTIRVLTTGVPTYDERMHIIRSARNSIYLSSYGLKADVIGFNVLVELCKKAQDGLDVRLLLDSYGSRSLKRPINEYPEYATSGETRTWKVWFFEACGGYLQFDNIAHSTLTDAAYVTHDKMLIVDGEKMVIGGSNHATYYYLASRKSEDWHDLDARIDGPVACWFHRRYVENWIATVMRVRSNSVDPMGGGGMSDDAVEHFFGLSELRECVGVPTGDVRIVPSYNNPFLSDRRPNLAKHLAAINASNSEIFLYAPYFVPNEEVVAALVKARVDRRVKVTILTNSPWSNDSGAVVFAGMYRRLKPLFDVGVEMRMWQPKSTMHRKFGMFDRRWIYFGSDNQDNRGQDYSSESIAYTDDPEAIRVMEREIAADLDLSFELTPEFARSHWSKIPGYTKFVARIIEDML